MDKSQAASAAHETSVVEPRKWIVLGSANGSTNLGDECMWLAAADAVRSVEPDAVIITDGASGWRPPIDRVEVLPYLYPALRRGRFLGPTERPLVAALERVISRPGAASYAAALAGTSPSPDSLGALGEVWATAIAASSGVIYSGAGAMNDDYAVHGVHSWRVIAEWAAAAGKPVAMVGQGIGPVDHPANRDSASALVQIPDYLGVRDAKSAAEAADLGRPLVRTDVRPDWALAVGIDARSRDVAERLHENYAASGPFVAVSVHRRASTRNRHLDALAEQVAELVTPQVRSGVRVIFVPNMTGSRYSDDRRTARELLARWPEELTAASVIHEGSSDAAVVKALLARADALISTRYHPLVFALSEGTPTIGVAYDDYYVQKLVGASRIFGVEGNVVRLGMSNPAGSIEAQVKMQSPKVEAGVREDIVSPLTRWIEGVLAR